MVDCTGLENQQAVTRLKGSNPLASAIKNFMLMIKIELLWVLLIILIILIQCIAEYYSKKNFTITVCLVIFNFLFMGFFLPILIIVLYTT